MKLPFFAPKKFLGIDIGTSAIKVVELSSSGNQIKLENYGEVSISSFSQKPFRNSDKTAFSLSTEEICRALKAIFEEAKIKTKKAFFSIPDFASFFTSFELPPMTKEEIPEAVKTEARKYIPIPLSEVATDWQVVSEKPFNGERKKIKILLVAVPNTVVQQYQQIGLNLNLEIISLEAEVFSLVRSLINEREMGVIGLIDAGARTTTCSIIERGTVLTSHSFDISGDFLTTRIARGFDTNFEVAEELKRKYGITGESPDKEKDLRELIMPLVNLILQESERTFKNFYYKERKEVEKIILAGGIALMPGLLEYFKKCFKKEVEIGNPFQKIFYPPILEETLKEMGPAYAIAIGLALHGFKK